MLNTKWINPKFKSLSFNTVKFEKLLTFILSLTFAKLSDLLTF